MRESAIEARLVRMVRERGGLCYKFVSPGNPGVPDRLVVLPDGRTVYVELKNEVGRLSKLQVWQHEELRRRGADEDVYAALQGKGDTQEALMNALKARIAAANGGEGCSPETKRHVVYVRGGRVYFS